MSLGSFLLLSCRAEGLPISYYMSSEEDPGYLRDVVASAWESDTRVLAIGWSIRRITPSHVPSHRELRARRYHRQEDGVLLQNSPSRAAEREG